MLLGVKNSTKPSLINRLLANSRFWILATGITMSFLIAGFIQLMIPSGTLQLIRIEQSFGFVSILLLYVALLASPLTKVFPSPSFKDGYIHARRAIGVMAFYYAFLHTYLTFYKQLNGLTGIQYYNSKYSLSLLLGTIGLGILLILTITSLDWAVNTLRFKNWKLIHRLVYIAGLTILLHIIIIGPHYTDLGFVSVMSYVGVAILLLLEAIRIRLSYLNRKKVARK